ncbi:hypothetical protein JCM10207_007104 [Rhodosporidiobolus poonsookiae]
MLPVPSPCGPPVTTPGAYLAAQADNAQHEERPDGRPQDLPPLGPIPLDITSPISLSLRPGSTYQTRDELQKRATRHCYDHGFRLLTRSSPKESVAVGTFALCCSLAREIPEGKVGCPFRIRAPKVIFIPALSTPIYYPWPAQRRAFSSLGHFKDAKEQIAQEGGFRLWSAGSEKATQFDCSSGHPRKNDGRVRCPWKVKVQWDRVGELWRVTESVSCWNHNHVLDGGVAESAPQAAVVPPPAFFSPAASTTGTVETGVVGATASASTSSWAEPPSHAAPAHRLPTPHQKAATAPASFGLPSTPTFFPPQEQTPAPPPAATGRSLKRSRSPSAEETFSELKHSQSESEKIKVEDPAEIIDLADSDSEEEDMPPPKKAKRTGRSASPSASAALTGRRTSSATAKAAPPPHCTPTLEEYLDSLDPVRATRPGYEPRRFASLFRALSLDVEYLTEVVGQRDMPHLVEQLVEQLKRRPDAGSRHEMELRMLCGRLAERARRA